jgi:hypothetical protein
MSENNINLSNDGSSYNTVWEDTVCGTGRFEARLGHIGQEYRDTVDTGVEATALLSLSSGRGPRRQIGRELLLQVVGAESGRAEGTR